MYSCLAIQGLWGCCSCVQGAQDTILAHSSLQNFLCVDVCLRMQKRTVVGSRRPPARLQKVAWKARQEVLEKAVCEDMGIKSKMQWTLKEIEGASNLEFLSSKAEGWGYSQHKTEVKWAATSKAIGIRMSILPVSHLLPPYALDARYRATGLNVSPLWFGLFLVYSDILLFTMWIFTL